MAQDQNLEEVLIARNNETGEVGAVTGLKEDGTPKMTDVKSAKLSDLVKFQKGQNPIEAFLSNFVRQCQNPTTFGFFRVPADRYDTVGTVIGDLAKDPEANAEMLKTTRSSLPAEEQKAEQPSQAATPAEQPAQAAASENAQATDKEVKHSAIGVSKIDWASLKEKWGIDRDALEKSGDLKEMLYNRKSKLVTVTPTFAWREVSHRRPHLIPHGTRRQREGRSSLHSPRAQARPEVRGLRVHQGRQSTALRETGNLGKVVELTDKNGNKVPSYVSIDRLTNEVVSVPVKDVFIRDTIGQTKLTIAEVMRTQRGQTSSTEGNIRQERQNLQCRASGVSRPQRGRVCPRRRPTYGTEGAASAVQRSAAVAVADKRRTDKAYLQVGWSFDDSPAAGGLYRRQSGSND